MLWGTTTVNAPGPHAHSLECSQAVTSRLFKTGRGEDANSMMLKCWFFLTRCYAEKCTG